MKALMVLVLCLPMVALAQATTCTGKFNTAGCRSFAELYDSRDAEIINAVTAPRVSFACFDPAEDRFSLVSYTPPASSQFKKLQYAYSATGVIYFSVYKNGVRDSTHMFFGNWLTGDETASEKTFSTQDDPRRPDDYASVSGSEISLTYSYGNLAETKTVYSLNVRRSTLRFQEKFHAKIKGEPTHFDSTGYCVAF